MHDQLTEAVRRILAEAAHLAGSIDETRISPEGLLWALIRDESRGSEILEQSRINWASFLNDWPELPEELPEDAPPLLADPLLMLSRLSEDILTAATQQASEAGRHAEIGSEHLLWGLLVVDSEVSAYLQEAGLSPSDVFARLPQQSGFETEPISVTEQLSLDSPTRSDQADAWRIIDAAANRCSEGMRVVEDVVRFRGNDPFGTRLLKEWRHDFSALVKLMPAVERLAMRDTGRDVGTSISTKSEQQRRSFPDLLSANFKRVEEALRSIEETSKLLGPAYLELPKQAEALRYRVYTLEKTILRSMSVSPGLSAARLYLLVTRDLCQSSAERVIEESLANGVDVIQLREKTLESKVFLDYARQVRRMTFDAGAILIINDRPDIAALCEADGVHLGQEDFSVSEARKILGSDKLIGRSTHSIVQARAAVLEGADYLGVGPVFASGTKEFSDHAGLDYVEQVTAEVALPWFAIGGITGDNVEQVLAAGANRVAVCGTVCGAKEPGYAASRLAEKLRSQKV